MYTVRVREEIVSCISFTNSTDYTDTDYTVEIQISNKFLEDYIRTVTRFSLLQTQLRRKFDEQRAKGITQAK